MINVLIDLTHNGDMAHVGVNLAIISSILNVWQIKLELMSLLTVMWVQFSMNNKNCVYLVQLDVLLVKILTLAFNVDLSSTMMQLLNYVKSYVEMVPDLS